jgi:hypothetical protein
MWAMYGRVVCRRGGERERGICREGLCAGGRERVVDVLVQVINGGKSWYVMVGEDGVVWVVLSPLSLSLSPPPNHHHHHPPLSLLSFSPSSHRPSPPYPRIQGVPSEGCF